MLCAYINMASWFFFCVLYGAVCCSEEMKTKKGQAVVNNNEFVITDCINTSI